MAANKVATFIAFHLDNNDKSQREIAQEAGFSSANVLAMMKSGTTKVPLDRVPKLAKALGVDPRKLFLLCIEEYKPELFATIKDILDGAFPLSVNEEKIIKKLRAISKNGDPPLHGRNEDDLKSFVSHS